MHINICFSAQKWHLQCLRSKHLSTIPIAWHCDNVTWFKVWWHCQRPLESWNNADKWNELWNFTCNVLHQMCSYCSMIPLIHNQWIWHAMHWSMLGHNDAHVLVVLSGFGAYDIEALYYFCAWGGTYGSGSAVFAFELFPITCLVSDKQTNVITIGKKVEDGQI